MPKYAVHFRAGKIETLRRKQVRSVKYASFPSVLVPIED